MGNFWLISRPISETVQDRTIYNDRLIGSHIHAFDWYQNHRPWMILNGQNALWCRKGASFEAHCKNLNEDRLIPSATKIRPMILVSGSIRCMQIFAGFPLAGASNESGVVDDGNFWRSE